MTHLVPPRWAFSIRARVAAWYTVVFALLLLLLGGALYAALDRSIVDGFDAALELRAEQIASGITVASGGLTVRDVTGELPGLSAATGDGQPTSATPGPAEANPLVGASATGESSVPSDVTFGTLVRILDAHGRAVYQSPSFRALSVPWASVSTALHGASWRATLTARGRQQVRLYSAAVSQGGTVYGVIQVGEPLSSVTATLDTVSHSLFLVLPCVLLLGTLGSYWLAGRAFRPIHRLTRTARQLSARDLHRQLPVPRARDEVQELALTLNEMLARLDTTLATQRRFMADASHELRTPVAAIRTMSDIALTGSSTFAECKRVLRRVNAQAEQLGTLISDLLLLAHADEDGPAMDHLPLRLDLLLAEVAAVAEASAQERGLALETRTSGPLLVLGDEARLIQAVSNLLENAIAYTHEGGRISVTAAQHDANATFTVRDTGVGIGAEHVPHIFQRFYRGDHARSRSAGGTGLGLAIVEWVISAHGGTIAVESQVGQGTAFTVTLPLVGPQNPTETTTVMGGHVSA